MNTLTLVFLCIDVLFVQNVFSTCYGQSPYAYSRTTPYSGSNYGYQATSITPYSVTPTYNYGNTAPTNNCGCSRCNNNGYNYNGNNAYGGYGYGGIGQGAVGVTSLMPVSTTKLCGSVPMAGAVQLAGPAQAATVTIAGQSTCPCGCGRYYS